MNTRDDLHAVVVVAQAFGVVLLFVVLYVARDVCMPLALGVLFAFLLSPVVNRLQRLGLPNLYAVLLTAIVVFFGLAYFLMLSWSSMADMSAELPKYREEILRKISSVRKHASGFVGQFSSLAEEVSEAVDQGANHGEAEKGNQAGHGSEGRSQDAGRFSSWFGSQPDDDRVNDGSSPKKPLYVVETRSQRLRLRSWTGSLGALVNPAASAGIVVVFTFFALIYRDDLRDRFTTVISRGNYVVTTEALDDAGSRISRYLMAQMILNVSYGAVFGLGLLGIGYFLSPTGEFPSVVLLAAVAGLVRFVPYLGPLVGAAVPLFFSIAIFPGYTVFFAVLTLIAVMELVSNNLVEPWLHGTSTGVSLVAIILAAVFWGWMWGPVGVLLATPLTVCDVECCALQ